MAVIYLSSTDRGGYDASMDFLFAVTKLANPGWHVPVDVGAYFPVNNALRKLAHILFFGIFTLLAVRAVQWGNPRLKPLSLLAVLLMGAAFAGSDALVRLQAPERHVRPEQFLLNGVGAAVTLLTVVLYFTAKSWERRLLGAGDSAADGETSRHSTP